MDLFAPTILRCQVQIPSTQSMLLSEIVKFMLWLSCEKNKMNNKRPGLAQLKNSSRQMPTKIGPKKLYNTGPLNLGELINTTLKTFKFSRELFLAFFRRSQFSTLFKSESDNLKPSINVKERKAWHKRLQNLTLKMKCVAKDLIS